MQHQLLTHYLLSRFGTVTTQQLAGKKEVARLQLHAGGTAQTIEQDLHGVLVANGIYAQIATGTGTVSVNFA